MSLTHEQDVLNVCDIIDAGGSNVGTLITTFNSRRDGLGAAVQSQCGNRQGTFVCDFVKSHPGVGVGIAAFLLDKKLSTTFFDGCTTVSPHPCVLSDHSDIHVGQHGRLHYLYDWRWRCGRFGRRFEHSSEWPRCCCQASMRRCQR